MDKDIDDLLDEVETKFVHYNPKKKSPASAALSRDTQTSRPGPQPAVPHTHALDNVIDDILDIDVHEEKNNFGEEHQQRSLATDGMCKSDQVKRCFPVFLGGSADNMGRSSATNRRACDQLRCTSCDFRVSCFDNVSWNKDTDYLFLRNNMPSVDKLQTKLHRKKGCRAYCCQCSWRNVLDLCQLDDPSLKWVCGKHSSWHCLVVCLDCGGEPTTSSLLYAHWFLSHCPWWPSNLWPKCTTGRNRNKWSVHICRNMVYMLKHDPSYLYYKGKHRGHQRYILMLWLHCKWDWSFLVCYQHSSASVTCHSDKRTSAYQWQVKTRDHVSNKYIQRLEKILTFTELHNPLSMTIIKCCIYSALVYGVKA